jgi:hypothetical protein
MRPTYVKERPGACRSITRMTRDNTRREDAQPSPEQWSGRRGFDSDFSLRLNAKSGALLRAASNLSESPSPPRLQAATSIDAENGCRLISRRRFAQSGRSSVGRVRASQARCRGFEPRRPLHFVSRAWVSTCSIGRAGCLRRRFTLRANRSRRASLRSSSNPVARSINVAAGSADSETFAERF